MMGLRELIAMITGSGNAMAQPGNVDQMDWLEGMTGSDEDGGTMEYLRQMNQLPEDGYSNGMPISPGDDDGVSHTLEQLIEQKMRNSGNTPINNVNAKIKMLESMRALNPQRAARSLDADPISALLEAKEMARPAAEMYMKDGIAPPLGRGPQGDMIRKFMYENIMKKQKDYQ